jgi:3-oxoacyl-[acyl-carrier-protein] synthase III
MRDMTEEEYDALDEELTRTVPEFGHTGKGFFSRKGSYVIFIDEATAKILNAKAMASRQTPSEVAAAILRKELIVSEDMNNSQIDYSDLPPMTEEERKTAQLYYKEFLDKLPPEMVKELIKRRLSEARVSEST